MNYLDLTRGVSWIEAHWPNTAEKAWRGWESIQEEFSPYTAGAFMEACHALFRAGMKYAPSPSEVVKAIQPIQARRIEHGIDLIERSCRGDHRWADPIPTDTDRRQTCVLCGESGGLVPCEHLFNRFGCCVYCPEKAPL